MTNATSLLVYPGPTSTHRFPCVASRHDERYGTLLGWAETADIASRAAHDFLTSKPVSFEELLAPVQQNSQENTK